MPHVAIAILNWNGKKFLEQFLPSVLATRYPDFSLHVIDNGSTDDSLPYLHQQYPDINVIALGRNLGFAEGYNEGLKQIPADYYVLLNSDVETTPGWLSAQVDLLEKDRTIAACQPKILQYIQRDHFEYAGACGGWIDQWGYPFSRGRVFDDCEKDLGQYDEACPLFWASGAAFLVRATAFWEAGGLDPFFFAHMEEIDLCWRLHALGYKVYCCPSAAVYHVGGGTLPKGNYKKAFLNFRNNLIMLGKNLPIYRAIPVLSLRFALDAVSAWKNLLSGDPVHFRAVLNAHLAFLKWLIGPKKDNRFPARKMVPREGYYRGSVVWQYFIKGLKTFSQIVH